MRARIVGRKLRSFMWVIEFRHKKRSGGWGWGDVVEGGGEADESRDEKEGKAHLLGWMVGTQD